MFAPVLASTINVFDVRTTPGTWRTVVSILWLSCVVGTMPTMPTVPCCTLKLTGVHGPDAGCSGMTCRIWARMVLSLSVVA
jgi:hypothetical protein